MKTRESTTPADAERILATTSAARDVPGGIRYDLEIVNRGEDEHVPAILTLPHAHAPVPAALLLHGLGSHKERMADTVGEALLGRGIAALAVDLPMHGGRSGQADLRQPNALRLLSTWKLAVHEARLAMAYLVSHDQLTDRLGVVGYSLGSFIANVVAASEPDVHAIVLAAGGDLPSGLPFETIVRTVMDPLRAVRRIGHRPLLMVNGRYDRTVTPAQAQRLFAAAPEPKSMRWYNGGHWPPPAEIEYAAGWLASQLEA